MENSPELEGKYLGTITEDFLKVESILSQGAYRMVKGNISQYPIFGMSKEERPLGELIIPKNYKGIRWNVYISFAENFVQRGLIEDSRVADFEKIFKDPLEFCCLCVCDNDFLKFVFLPYPEDELP